LSCCYLPAPSALLIVDLQKAIDDPVWAKEGPRNNFGAEESTARLLTAWRRIAWPVFHIRHDSTFTGSPYRPGQAGNDFKDEVRPLSGEAVIAKRTNSAFIGTDLEARLRQARIQALVVTGVVTNNSVEATVRMAGNLGFVTYLVEDACFTFARRDYAGQIRTAEEVHAMSLANLDEEYCRIVSGADVIAAMAGALIESLPLGSA
jgi:nicotinamidase-related amidase